MTRAEKRRNWKIAVTAAIVAIGGLAGTAVWNKVGEALDSVAVVPELRAQILELRAELVEHREGHKELDSTDANLNAEIARGRYRMASVMIVVNRIDRREGGDGIPDELLRQAELELYGR